VEWEIDELVPERKLRSGPALNFAGGGGINVARVIKTLGGMGICVFTAGKFTGQYLRELVEHHGLLTRAIPIEGRTRVSPTIFETKSGAEYRITPPGPEVTETEWQECLDAAFEFESSYIVATGSLPQGVPVDFYARVARRAKKEGRRVILDTSGDYLPATLEEGVYLVKPNRGELERLLGREAETETDLASMSRELIDAGKAEVVAVSLGRDGAFLAWDGGSKILRTPDVEVKSAVGAGDSFVGGVTIGLARGLSMEQAFTLGVASGTAAVLTAGTALCLREDVERLYRELSGHELGF